MDRLSEDNFMMYAIKNYTNQSCSGIKEFREDLNHIKYIKRLFGRYTQSGDLRVINLILNHLILLYNVFESEAMTKMLFYRLDSEYWSLLKTFLVKLSRMPETIEGVTEERIKSVDIPMVMELFAPLREI
tara:strand:+ start:399 stop:788 length:390 start_codon:yes stop_codon:yes gene_type:complete